MRKILIIPVDTVNEYQKMATENEIGEIVEGIPTGLSHLYNDDDLPIIHTEESEQPKEPTEIEILKQENTLLKAQNQALTDRTDFHEELIAEMAMLVYQ
ncbi:hypothetical protein [Peribacillus asahii]|uniref:hypothetical protein n=1 Tax=Peribacillus asahii TaxID=228899 RepID=UPI003803C851